MKFKVGDRVKIKDQEWLDGGTVTEIFTNGISRVVWDNASDIFFLRYDDEELMLVAEPNDILKEMIK